MNLIVRTFSQLLKIKDKNTIKGELSVTKTFFRLLF